MSPAEISAAVSALLGFAPSATLTADGSSKVFECSSQVLFFFKG